MTTDFDMAIGALCRPRSRQAVQRTDLNSASRKLPGQIAALVAERDKIWLEVQRLGNQIAGLDIAIAALRDDKR